MSSKEQTFSTSSCSSSSGYTGYCTSCNKCSTCTTTTTTSSSNISSATQQAEMVKAQIYDDEFLKVQQSLLQPGIENSEKRFKVHQFTRSAMMLPDFKDFDRLRPLIDGLIDELDARDLLGCATALELLADIAAARNENIRYFDQIGLMDKVYDLFKFTKENPDFGVIHIACIRFFGYLSTAEPNSLAMFPLFASDVFNAVYCFDAIDPVRRMLAFDTLAIVSSTSGAKQFLSWKECPYNMNKAMNHLGVAIATGMPELKARYLNAVKTIFESFNPDCALESPVILHGWFRELGEPFPQLLLQCLKMPFPEVQIASLQAMLALMCHQWAPAYFSTLNGFLDFLTDRERHFPALGHQLKYDLVCRFIESEPAQFDPQSMQRLHNYHVSGPYAPPKKVDIETEESG